MRLAVERLGHGPPVLLVHGSVTGGRLTWREQLPLAERWTLLVAERQLLYIPLGPSKIFPVQHFINVVTSVLLGPYYSIACAFLISLLRNVLGTGSLLAFPGSMIGAGLAGLLFLKTRKIGWAAIGEVVGTGIIGALVSYPIAKLLYGMDIAAFYFILPFLLSTIVGSLIAYIFLKSLRFRRFRPDAPLDKRKTRDLQG